MPNNDWVNRTTKQHLSRMSPGDMSLEFGGSFVGADGNAASTVEWIYNPDITLVSDHPTKYWVIVGDAISLMSQAEQDVITATELDNERDNTVGTLDSTEDLLRAFALTLLDEINTLRSQHSLAPRTIAQLKSAIRAKLGS